MTVAVRPSWDPTGTLRVSVDRERRELVVSVEGERIEFTLRTERPDQLGWVRRTPPRGRVPVGEVVAHCLREWDAEQEVLGVTEQTVREARAHGPAWLSAAKRLQDQVRSARHRRRMAVLPFQLLWRELAEAHGGPGLSVSTAALRAGFRNPDGSADTSRLERRLGLRPYASRWGRETRNHSVNSETRPALCRALGLDPAEVGF